MHTDIAASVYASVFLSASEVLNFIERSILINHNKYFLEILLFLFNLLIKSICQDFLKILLTSQNDIFEVQESRAP